VLTQPKTVQAHSSRHRPCLGGSAAGPGWGSPCEQVRDLLATHLRLGLVSRWRVPSRSYPGRHAQGPRQTRTGPRRMSAGSAQDLGHGPGRLENRTPPQGGERPPQGYRAGSHRRRLGPQQGGAQMPHRTVPRILPGEAGRETLRMGPGQAPGKWL
jgi:hypothetical protein